MGILSKITNFVSGGLFKEIKEGVMSYFPPDMSPADKAAAELKVMELLHKKEMETNQILAEAAAALDNRIAEQEGTAADLKTIPYIGPLLILARGAQRPVWGFATLYMDQQWFFAESAKVFSEKQETALIVINLLVLGFLFGERAVKNLTPLILKVWGNKS